MPQPNIKPQIEKQIATYEKYLIIWKKVLEYVQKNEGKQINRSIHTWLIEELNKDIPQNAHDKLYRAYYEKDWHSYKLLVWGNGIERNHNHLDIRLGIWSETSTEEASEKYSLKFMNERWQAAIPERIAKLREALTIADGWETEYSLLESRYNELKAEMKKYDTQYLLPKIGE